MISKHVAYEAAHDDYKALARYIADAGHEGEKCLAHWCAGCAADDDYELAVLEAQAVQALNTRSGKEKNYHLLVSFRPEDESLLTPEAFQAIEARFASALGFSEHQRHCGIHKNTNNIHMHIAYNMIHPERHTRHEPFRDYATRDKLCRELEQEYGLMRDNGREQHREDALTPKAATIEAQTGQQSFESYAKKHKGVVLEAVQHARYWQDVHEALKSHGMGIKPHGNGLVITDLHGNHHAKASTIDRALSAKHLLDKFGAFQPYRSLRPIQELSRYESAPLHRGAERGELFARFKAGIEARKERLEDIKAREDARLTAVREKWEAQRREIEGNPQLLKRNRRNLVSVARKHEADALAQTRQNFRAEREAVRRDIPFTSWSGFLRQEAEQGNETALAVLRSCKEATVLPMAPEQTPASELMTRALDEARRQGQDFGPVVQRVDGKGTVIFTLQNGSTLRDTGKKVFFTCQDAAAANLATAYAVQKWGPHMSRDAGRVVYAPAERERENAVEAPRKRGLER